MGLNVKLAHPPSAPPPLATPLRTIRACHMDTASRNIECVCSAAAQAAWPGRPRSHRALSVLRISKPQTQQQPAASVRRTDAAFHFPEVCLSAPGAPSYASPRLTGPREPTALHVPIPHPPIACTDNVTVVKSLSNPAPCSESAT